MATYKVLQDIEAEDKLLGPLSLRQFIYAVIVVVLLFAMFKLFFVQPLLILPFLPPAILFGILAAPFGHDQSSEIWLLAKIRFALKPRRRIWDQSGLQELVKVTAPKRIEKVLSDGLDEGQVKSRLQALAETIDTRGWAIKGVSSNLYAAPTLGAQAGTNDRLLSPTFNTPVDDTTTDDDILDVQNNPLAQHMGQMVQASDQTRRQALMAKMRKIRDSVNGQAPAQPVAPAPVPATAPAAIEPTPTPQSPAPTPAAPAPVVGTDNLDNLKLPPKSPQNPYGHTAVLRPDLPAAQAAPNAAPVPAAQPVTAPAQPAILKLASNDDLSVATIAHQAEKANGQDDNEVVVSLH